MSATYDPALDPTPLLHGFREPEAGDLLAERYQLLTLIGEGGMARVFHARDQRLQRDVAVKLQRPGAPAPPQQLREERVASVLIHPNIVAIFDGGELPDGAPGAGARYIVMEYVPGMTAAAAAPLPWREAAEIVRQAASGLAAAHAHGIVHNDIKPSNLLLDSAGHVKLADFGAAATLETEIGDVVHGSPAYIAPERLRGARPAPCQDIYGLGGVLAFLLTGRHPRQDEPSAPPELPADCPAPIARVIARSRAPEPDARFPDAAAFSAALDSSLLPTEIRRVSPPARRPAPAPASAARAVRAPRAHPRPSERSLAERPSRLAAVVAALALVLTLALGVGLVAPRVVGTDAAPAGAVTAMPALSGATLGAALDQLAAQGLTVERVDVVYGPGPANVVVAQDPPPGKALHAGDKTRLVIRASP